MAARIENTILETLIRMKTRPSQVRTETQKTSSETSEETTKSGEAGSDTQSTGSFTPLDVKATSPLEIAKTRELKPLHSEWEELAKKILQNDIGSKKRLILALVNRMIPIKSLDNVIKILSQNATKGSQIAHHVLRQMVMVAPNGPTRSFIIKKAYEHTKNSQLEKELRENLDPVQEKAKQLEQKQGTPRFTIKHPHNHS